MPISSRAKHAPLAALAVLPHRHALGCRPDTADHRDVHFTFAARRLPPKIDLTAHCPPVMDQGQLGSCTAHGITAAARYHFLAEGGADTALSCLMLYFDERALEHTIASDAGAEIRDGLKSLNHSGVAPEADWPYDPARFTAKPPARAYADAKPFDGWTFRRVPPTGLAIRSALAEPLPVIIGVSVYASFESDAVAKTGLVPMPAAGEELLGGHCMLVIGYDDGTRRYRVRNSWGASWGDGGDCHLPYDYLVNPNYCSDLWVLTGRTAAERRRAA